MGVCYRLVDGQAVVAQLTIIDLLLELWPFGVEPHGVILHRTTNREDYEPILEEDSNDGYENPHEPSAVATIHGMSLGVAVMPERIT